jgi:hypothetical protein
MLSTGEHTSLCEMSYQRIAKIAVLALTTHSFIVRLTASVRPKIVEFAYLTQRYKIGFETWRWRAVRSAIQILCNQSPKLERLTGTRAP